MRPDLRVLGLTSWARDSLSMRQIRKFPSRFNPTLPLKDFGLRVVKLKIGELHFWFGEILVLVYFWWEESGD